MDQKYLQDLYALVTSKDSTYSQYYTYEKFVERMQDSGYAQQLIDWVKLVEPNFDPTGDALNRVKVSKEKPTSEAPSENMLLLKKKEDPGILDLSSDQFLSGLFGGVQIQDNTNNSFGEKERRLQFEQTAFNQIDGNLIAKTEEYVVPQMKYLYGDLGFKFDESGFGDYVTVTAPNGQTQQFGLDSWTDAGAESTAGQMRDWMNRNIGTVPQSKIDQLVLQKQAGEKKFTSDKEVEEENKRFSQEADAFQKELTKYTNEKTSIQEEENQLNQMTIEQKATPAYAEAFKKLNERKQKFISDGAVLEQKYGQIERKEAKLQENIGKYTEMKSQQGTWYGGLINAVATGFGRMGAAAGSAAADMLVEILPTSSLFQTGGVPVKADDPEIYEIAKKYGFEPPKKSKNKAGETYIGNQDWSEWWSNLPEQVKNDILSKRKIQAEPQKIAIEKAKSLGYDSPKEGQDFMTWLDGLPSNVRQQLIDEQQDIEKKKMKYGKDGDGPISAIRESHRNLWGDKSTTIQWSDAAKQDFWGGAFLGLAESLPAMLGSSTTMGWAMRTAQMYAQTTDNVMEEIQNDPELSKLSENEKLAVTAPIGVAGAVLETYGLRNMIGGKGLLNGLVARALGKAGVNTTAKSFGRFIREDVDNMIARGLLTVGAAGLAEFETGAAQQFSEMGIKEIWNIIQEKKNAGKDKEAMPLFNTPESIGEWAIDILKSGAQEAIGGFVLGVPNAVGTAYTKRGFKGMDDESFMAFEAMANDEKLQSAYIVSLKNKVNKGELTMAQAKESLSAYRNSVGLFRSLPDGLTLDGKKDAMNLLRERQEIEQTILGKDKALTKPQQNRINQINEELNKLSENAIQEQSTNESVLRNGFTGLGLQGVGEGNRFRQVGGLQETSIENEKSQITSSVEQTKNALNTLTSQEKSRIPLFDSNGNKIQIDGAEEQASTLYHAIRSLDENKRTEKQQSFFSAMDNALTELAAIKLIETQQKLETPTINVAPFFDTQVKTKEEAEQLRQDSKYQGFISELETLATSLGLTFQYNDKIGGYVNNEGTDITELSMLVSLPGATIDQAEEYAALAGALAPNVQESTIAAQYTETDSDNHNANEYQFQTSDVNGTMAALKEAGISNFTIDDKTGVVTFVDVKDFADPNLETKFEKLISLLNSKNIQYDEQTFTYRPIESRFIETNRRKEIIRNAKSKRSDIGQGRSVIRDTIDRAIKRDAEFQRTTEQEYTGEPKPTSGPVAGNRLFNKPLSAVKEIADRYYQRIFGKQRPKYAGTRGLDEAKAKRISDAFEALKHDPYNPEVRAAYEALAKETVDQYQALLDAGYVVEVNNEEPYDNSEEMIEDLRKNKRIKIFSTESGFGDSKITEQQRAENPLLAKTEFTDKNGVPLLINDLFRAVHDFFGHAELGNSFGPKGEENAWNVHVRMFSPIAARAMTTETRGQNSYVNFSGVNDPVNQLREKARKLRKDGAPIEEVRKVIAEIYNIASFADQKVGLLPLEFSSYDENDTGDTGRQGPNISEKAQEAEKVSSKTQENFEDVANLDTKNETNLQKVYNFLDNIDQSLDKFGRETAGINLALPVMKAIVKSLKALVQGGMLLSDAIKKVAADNNVSEQDVIDSMIVVSRIEQDEKPEGYERLMGEVDGIVERMNQRGEYDPKEILNSVLAYVQGSKSYQDATDVQRENLVREMREKFGQRERTSPTADRITGRQRTKITVDELSALNQQIRLEINAAKKGAKSVSDAIKAILRYFNDIKDRGNLTNKDLLKVLSIVSNVKDQKTLDKAADKIYNIVKNATTDTIEVSESKALKEGLRRQAIAAREAKKDLNEKRRIVGAWIKEMAKSGQITTRQAAVLVNRLSNLNLDNQLLFDRFLDYAEKVFNDADYSSKLNEANSLRKAISKLSKNKDKSANLRNFGKKFLELNPSMVEDLDTYIDMASKLKESLRGSTIRQGNVSFADIINVENANQYLQDSLDEQSNKMKEEALAELQELLGVDFSQFSYEDIVSLLEGNQKITKYDDAKVMDDVKKAFNLYSSIINKILETGKDPFSDPNDPSAQDIELSKTQKRVIREFMSMNLNRISKQEALDAVDALVNFIQNQSTAKMEDVYSRYLGSLNIAILRSKNISAKPLRKYFSKSLGRLLSSYTTNLGPLFERMFKGVLRGGLVEDMSGLTKVKNGKALAEKLSTIISNDYIKQFYSRKANGEAFNSSYNIVERGMVAFLLRNVIGTQAEREAEFKRRIDLLKESIAVLKDGNELEQKKGDIYQQVFDNIFDLQTESGENVIPTGVYLDEDLDAFMLVDQYGNAYQRPISYVNIEGIKYWRDRWSEVFDDLSDVSENVYNKILDRDEFYTTDRYSRLMSVSTPVEIANDQSAFHENNGTIYQKEAGVLMSATRPKALPVNKNGQVERYIDLGFDNNNANSMYDALVDINTASAIRQVDGFVNSKDFSKLVPQKEDADLLKERIRLYIGAIRNKNPYENDELKKFSRKLNKIAALGVSQSLGGVFQPLKQVIPIIPNTLINAGRLDLGTVFNAAKMRFIDESGYSIANRGFQSQAQIDSINKMVEEASTSKLGRTLDLISKLNELYLKILLVAPDVAIARASWLSYYEQSLKKQGIDIRGIDWDTHQLNEEAANYAQRMLDRQQNISDPDQSGKLFMKGNEARSLMVKMFMPFASFRLNQATRLSNDLSTLGHWGTSSKEDKVIAIRSLAGYAAETVLFKGMSAGITIALGSIAAGAIGDEDEEDRQKRVDNAIKGQVTSLVTDLLSPVPFLDKAVQLGVYNLKDIIDDISNIPDQERINIFNAKPDDFIKNLGLFGIGAERAYQIWELISLGNGGSFKDNYGKRRYIDQSTQEVLLGLVPFAFGTGLGILPSEVNSVIRSTLRIAKKEESSSVEGGQSEFDEFEEAMGEEYKAAGKEEKQIIKSEKIDAINELRNNENISLELDNELDKMLLELSMTDSERRAYSKKSVGEKIAEDQLLGKYKNRTEMKRYDPDLYEQTFGENSEYARLNKPRKDAEKLLKEYLQGKRDKEFNYTPKKEENKGGKWESEWQKNNKQKKWQSEWQKNN